MQTSTRERLIALLVAATFSGIALWGYLSLSPQVTPAEPEMRMPAGKPLLEPDRPDLIGDPGIATDEPDENEDDVPEA